MDIEKVDLGNENGDGIAKKQKEPSAFQRSALAKLEMSVIALCNAKAGVRANGKVASLGTIRTTINVGLEAARRLHRLGYLITDIHNLGERHVHALVEGWHKSGLSPKTMQNQLSRLRQIAKMIDKPTLVKSSGGVWAYLPGVEEVKVKTVATKSKSWSGNGIDVNAKIAEADAYDQRMGMMLRLVALFGLRKSEQLMFRPWDMDGGTVLKIEDNIGKGGRYRVVPIFHELQRIVLDYAKTICKKGEHMGWPGRSLEQNQNRYKYIMRKILKITLSDADCVGHGLRAEFVENKAMQLGLLPPTMGGTAKQMDIEKRKQIERLLSQDTGHNRTKVLGAYYGSFRLNAQSDGLGERITGIAMGDGTHDVAGIFVNPSVKADKAGTYRKKTDTERSDTSVTVLREVLGSVGTSAQKYAIADFIKQHPHLSEPIASILAQVGL